MGYKIGADVGGTFTDFLVVDENGKQGIFKTPSTPEDPSIVVLKGLEGIAVEEGKTLKDFLPQVIAIHGRRCVICGESA